MVAESNSPAYADSIRSFLAPPQEPDEIGRLAQYRILATLGQGGMGVVFKAEDVDLRRLVALKVIRPEIASLGDVRARFMREARAAAGLRNDHVVVVYQVGEDRGVPFLAMEFLTGESLEDWLKADGSLTVDDALRLGKQIAKGLAAAHAVGLVHRDIKPSNLWIESPSGRVKILDFGLARLSTGDSTVVTQAGAVVGTPAYMSPEQGRGDEVDERSDLFSFGCVLYRMLAGRLPFSGASLHAMLAAVATETPRPLEETIPDIPPALSRAIFRLLEKEPRQRIRSADEVLKQLSAIEREWKTGALSQTRSRGTSRLVAATLGDDRRRTAFIIANVVAAIIVTAIILAVALARLNSPTKNTSVRSEETKPTNAMKRAVPSGSSAVAVPVEAGSAKPTVPTAPTVNPDAIVGAWQCEFPGEKLATLRLLRDGQAIFREAKGGWTLVGNRLTITLQPPKDSKIKNLRWEADLEPGARTFRASGGRAGGLSLTFVKLGAQ